MLRSSFPVTGPAHRTVALLALVLAGAQAAALPAQVQMTLTPFAGSYFPLRQFNHFDDPATLTKGDDRQTNAAALGVKATVWLNPRIGVEADLSYAFSGRFSIYRTETDSAGGNASNLSGNVVTVTGRLVYRPRRSNLMLAAGAGYMQRGGDAWNDKIFQGAGKFNNGNFTGVISVGTRGNVTRGFPILVSVDLLLYSLDKFEIFDQAQDALSSRKKFQADVLVKLGVPLGAR